MRSRQTDRQRIVNDRLVAEGGLQGFLRRRRAFGTSYREIAREIEVITGERVSYETIGRWVRQLEGSRP